MPIMEITVVPLGTGSPSVSGYIRTAVDVLKGIEDIRYEMTPMGTIVESDSLEKLFETAGEMHKAVLACSERVVTSIRVDDRKDKKLSMEGKMKAVSD
jgi:uncharacterized protein (TIGR00106 family)